MQMPRTSPAHPFQDKLTFAAALEEARDQLDWGTAVLGLRTAAFRLSQFEPSHVLVRQLELKALRLIAAGLGRESRVRHPFGAAQAGEGPSCR